MLERKLINLFVNLEFISKRSMILYCFLRLFYRGYNDIIIEAGLIGLYFLTIFGFNNRDYPSVEDEEIPPVVGLMMLLFLMSSVALISIAGIFFMLTWPERFQ